MASQNHGGEIPFSNSHQHGVSATTDAAVLSPAPPLAVVQASFPLNNSAAEEKTKIESQMMTSAPPLNSEDSNNNGTNTSGVAAPVLSENGRKTESNNTNGAAKEHSSTTTALKDPLQPPPPAASSPPVEAASKEGNSSSSMMLKQAASGTAPSVSFDQWVCEGCTFLNPNRKRKCEMCQANNPVSTTKTFTEDATSTGTPPPPPPQPADVAAATAKNASAATLKDPPASSPRQQPHSSNTTTASGLLPTRALGKRPSPWREPRIQLPPPAKEVQVQHHSPAQQQEKRARRRSARRAQRRYRRLFQDSVTVQIPLTVTADLGVAVQRTREKRVTGLYEQFPALKRSGDDDDDADPQEDDGPGASLLDKKLKGEATTTVDEDGKKKKKLQKLKHVPQRDEYASVLDYLEAKYVQGVVVDDGASAGGETGDNDDDDEGQGSVYSETSFLDDTGLQRTVAEQVLGHTTTTKLERQDDDAFFVNVGDLEVEENEMTLQTYDPLEDTKGDKSKKPRKRKKATPGDATKVSKDAKGKTNGKAANKKSTTAAAAASTSEPPKKKKAKTSKDGKESKPAPPTGKKTKTKDVAILKLQKTSETRQAKVDRLYAKLVQLIQSATEEALPRKAKPEKTRVTITCPMDKNPGDAITFVNPHMNQKLKCNVPKNIRPGGSFKVTVPKPAEEIDPDKDYNRLGRKFYDTLETYARTYDEWCDTEGEYRKATGDKDFNAHFSKRNKFDKLTTEFPNQDLKTVVDKAYLQKILRRARQNKHKRKQQQQQQAKPEHGSTGGAGSGGGSEEEDENNSEEEEEENAPQEPAAKKVKMEVKVEGKKAKPKKMALVPHMTLEFITKQFDPDDFNT